MAAANDPVKQPEMKDRRRWALLMLAQYLFVALLLFLSAGDMAWRKGWLFLPVSLGGTALITPNIWRVNPELPVARSRFRWAKRWDVILSALMVATITATIVVAALNDGRFHWFPVPWWVCGIGYLLYLVAMARHLGWES
jgi:hypothetical protein